MEKFLSIPVTDTAISKTRNQLVSITGVKGVAQTAVNQIRVYYLDGRKTEITYGVSISDAILRLDFEKAMLSALTSGWTQVVTEYIPYGYIANAETPDEPTNPVSAITIT